jgi:hypothetical protein
VRDRLFLPDIDCDRLYETDSYSHANVNRFYVKPYQLDLDTLSAYRDRILALRQTKRAAYRQRMQTHFGIDSESMRAGDGAAVRPVTR